MNAGPRCSLISVAALVLTVALPCSAQTSRRTAPCPARGDTVSLLQPTDSAFGEARRVSAFLTNAGLDVLCVTRSEWTGLVGVGNVAAFQTARGTITVFLIPPAERFLLVEKRTPRGYRITYSKAGVHPARTVMDTNNAQYVIQRRGWYFHVIDASLAEVLRVAVGDSL
jgi:hypothetical protein